MAKQAAQRPLMGDARSVHQSQPLGQDDEDLAEPATQTGPTQDKAEVHYRKAVNQQKCAECRFMDADAGTCQLVKGSIKPAMTCDLFSPIDHLKIEEEDPDRVQRLSDATVQQFYNLADLKLEDISGKGSCSWIPIFPEGVFHHPEYGELDFSRPQLEKYLKNFNDRVRKIDLCVDIDHKQEQAAGWIKRLEYQGGPKPGLYALVEWNSFGAGLLNDRRYKYISPQFGEFTDEESGQVFPNTLTCATLTNFPFLKKMPAIALSEMASALAEVSSKPWSSVNKSKLPRSSFLVPGDPKDKATWKLPVYEGAGQVGENGTYGSRGPLNVNAVKAAHAAVHGARSGKAMSIPQPVHDRLHRWIAQHSTQKEGGLSARQRSAAEIAELKSLSDPEYRRFYLMSDRSLTLPQFIKRGGAQMGKPKQDDNDEDMKDLADASDDAAKEAGAPDESAMKQAKKAKRAGDKADDDAKADDGYDDEDLYQDGSNDNFEEASKNKSQPHLRPSGKAKASTPTAAEPKGGDKSLREAVDLLASDNRRLAEQVRELKLKERKAEVKDQIRQLSDGKTRFAKPVVEEFEKLALADSKAGDKAFALLKQVKATGLIDLAEKGRSSDVEDELNDPYSIDDKVLSDSNGHAIVGQGLVERAQRYCAEQKLDWEDLADRTKAITAVTKSRTAGVDNGIKRD